MTNLTAKTKIWSNHKNFSGKFAKDNQHYNKINFFHIRVVATTPRKDPQPNISDLRDHSQSIFRPILTRIKKKKKKKLPPLYIDQLKCGIRPPPYPRPPTLFGGPLCERTERGRDMKISGIVYLDTADALKYVKI